MAQQNPYSSPSAVDAPDPISAAPSTRRLWIAYLIAPSVAPLLAALTVFVVGMAFLVANPEDTGTPIGVILVPLFLLIAGIPASYLVAGTLGMPIAFYLRSRNRLNGLTVHGAAFAWTAVLALGLTASAFFLAPGEQVGQVGLLQYMLGLGGVFLAFAPFIALSATTFWLVGVRRASGAK